MMKQACIALTGTVFLLPAAVASSPQPWQEMQIPTAAQVAAVWEAPPPEYGPEPYYGLNGSVRDRKSVV